MRIVKLTAENFKKLRTVEITPTGDLVQITGANGSGKTSVLDSIWAVLAGKGAVPARPVRVGEERATITLDLGEITVIRRFTADGYTSLAVEANGAQYKSPQTMLDTMLGALTFDPLAFTRMSQKDQLTALRQVVKVEVDLDELARLNAADFAARTTVNRRITSLKAQLEAQPSVPDALPHLIDETAILECLTNVSAQNADVTRLVSIRDGKVSDGERFTSEARINREEAARLLALADSQEKAAADEAASVLAMVIPLPLDASAIRAELDQAQRSNAEVGRAQKVRALVADITLGLKNDTAEAKSLTDAMEARTAARTQAIAAAAFPVPGLSFGDDGVLYNDLPFEQASGAEQLRVSMALAMAANPTLRVLRIKDGSLLDEHSLAMVAELARERDYQVWIESVDTSGKVGIVMEDGSVRGAIPVEIVEGAS